MRGFLCALIAFSGLTPVVHAQEFPPVFVLPAGAPEHADDCGYTHTSIVAAVKSELRHNRIPISTDGTGNAIWAYVETIGDDRREYGLCAVAYRFTLAIPQWVQVGVTQEQRWEKIEFCNRWGLMSGPVADIQPALNNSFRDMTSQCITEYLEE